MKNLKKNIEAGLLVAEEDKNLLEEDREERRRAMEATTQEENGKAVTNPRRDIFTRK